MLKRLVLTILFSLLCYSSALASMFTTYITGDDVEHLKQSAYGFYGPSDRYHDFWTNWTVYSDSYFDSEITFRGSYTGSWDLDSGGSLTAAETNISNIGLVTPLLYSISDGAKIELNSSTELLTDTLYPENSALGFVLKHSFSHYVTSYSDGEKNYTISSLFNEDEIPEGYKAYAETTIYISCYDSWIGEDGRAESFSVTYMDKKFKGDFELSFSLPRNINDIIPGSTSDYASMSVCVETRLVFAPDDSSTDPNETNGNDLAQTIILTSPDDGAVLSGTFAKAFSWGSDPEYVFKLEFSPSAEFNPNLPLLSVPRNIWAPTTTTDDIPEELWERTWNLIKQIEQTSGVIYWRVVGLNIEASELIFSEVRSFSIE